MATKRQVEAPDLKPETVAVLLAGWSANPPPDVTAGPHGFGGGFLELYDVGGIARLWREHEAWLREQAAAWQWEPTYTLNGVPMFYAESVANGGPE